MGILAAGMRQHREWGGPQPRPGCRSPEWCLALVPLCFQIGSLQDVPQDWGLGLGAEKWDRGPGELGLPSLATPAPLFLAPLCFLVPSPALSRLSANPQFGSLA